MLAPVNIKRGLMRLWAVFSILWAGSFLGMSPLTWYWYDAAWLWLNKPQVRVTEQKNSVGVCFAPGRKCFDVIAPNGSRYVVKVADTETEASVANIVGLNPDKFSNRPQDPKGGFGNDPYFVDLTDPWVVIGREPHYSSLAKAFIAIAFAVPLAILALGYAISWIVKGFSPRTS